LSGVAEPRSCESCRQGSSLFCDGCAVALCEACAVTVEENATDFCPRCCRPLFVKWFSSSEGKRFEGIAAALHLDAQALKDQRRNNFRRWVRDTAEAQAALTALRLPKSVMMVRVLTSAQRADAESYVATSGRPYVVIETVRIAAGTPIHEQWSLEQLAKK